MQLTEATIRAIKPAEKPQKMTDGGGLYLLVTPAGGKWWRWDYRYAGKRKTLSMGVYPDVSLRDARTARDEARVALAKGIDPGETRKAEKAAGATGDTFEIVAREWHMNQSETWAKGHTKRILRRLELDVFPWIGARSIGGLSAPEVLAVIRRIEARGAIQTAHRALQNCGQVFRYAVATGRAERDPTGDLRGALKPIRAEHFPAITEPARVGELLRMIDGYAGGLIVRCALQLAPLVFVRPGELRTARWVDIDLDAAEWRYQVSKTNTSHIVPLSRQAVAVLRELQPLTGRSAFVFPGARYHDRPMSDNAILAAFRRMGIPKDEMTGHGFRAMARTILDEVLGVRVDLIEHQLAHAVKDPNGRAYNRTAHLPERRKMMQQWADYLDGLRLV